MKIFFVDISAINFDEKKHEFLKILSATELQKYELFTSPNAARQFLIGRFLIKKVLAKILGVTIQKIELKIVGNGRVEIAAPVVDLSFNLSHSGNLVVLAASNRPIGIDVEYLKRRNFDEIAAEIFEPKQIKILSGLDDEKSRQCLFYELWTRREALIKSFGASVFNHKIFADDFCEVITLAIFEEVILSTVIQHPRTDYVRNNQVELIDFFTNLSRFFVMDQTGKWREQIR